MGREKHMSKGSRGLLDRDHTLLTGMGPEEGSEAMGIKLIRIE